MKLCLLVFFLPLTFTMSGCCAKGTFSIVQEPRFSVCTGTNPATGRNDDPTARQGQSATSFTAAVAMAHNECNGRGQDLISGFDSLYRYDKAKAIDANDRVFQAVRVTVDEGVTATACGDKHMITHPDTIEYFLVPANDTIGHFRCCEGTMKVEESGSVAIIDLTDLPDDIQKTLKSSTAPTATEAVRIELLLTTDQKQRLLKEIEDCAKIKWKETYQYDGCDPGPIYSTSCHRQNCLDLEWTDSNGTQTRHFER